MRKIIILKILLFVFITSTAIFAWLFFMQDKNTIREIPLPYNRDDVIVSGKLATTTDNRAIEMSEYVKINAVYAKKDGAIYYAGPLKRYTEAPEYSKVEGADPETFTVYQNISTELGFARDKNHIFFDGRMTDIDTSSFEIISDRYFKDKDYVYFAKNNRGKYSLEKMPYDPKTFKIFATGSNGDDYIIDKNGVYYAGKIIPGVDPNTFSTLSSPQELLTLQRGMKDGPPPLSQYYMRDANNIIYRGKILPGADPRSFKVIPTGPYAQEYGKDNKNVYYQDSVISGADPETFKPLTYQVYEGCAPDKYAVDANAVYYKNTKIEGADPNTFKALFNGYGKDKNNVYLRGVIQENLNPQTFTSECNYG